MRNGTASRPLVVRMRARACVHMRMCAHMQVQICSDLTPVCMPRDHRDLQQPSMIQAPLRLECVKDM